MFSFDRVMVLYIHEKVKPILKMITDLNESGIPCLLAHPTYGIVKKLIKKLCFASKLHVA